MLISITDLRQAWIPIDTISATSEGERHVGDRDPDDNPPEPALALAA
jgi:hypothetical protein